VLLGRDRARLRRAVARAAAPGARPDRRAGDRRAGRRRALRLALARGPCGTAPDTGRAAGAVMSDPTPHHAEPAATPPPPGPAPEEPPVVDPALAEASLREQADRETVPPAPPNRGGGVLPVIYVIGLVVLIASLIWLWRNPTREGAAPAQTAALDQLR